MFFLWVEVIIQLNLLSATFPTQTSTIFKQQMCIGVPVVTGVKNFVIFVQEVLQAPKTQFLGAVLVLAYSSNATMSGNGSHFKG